MTTIVQSFSTCSFDMKKEPCHLSCYSYSQRTAVEIPRLTIPIANKESIECMISTSYGEKTFYVKYGEKKAFYFCEVLQILKINLLSPFSHWDIDNTLLGQFAIIANFLCGKEEYDYIEDIENFKNDYEENLLKNTASFETNDPFNLDFSNPFPISKPAFDLSLLEAPRLIQSSLVFYVHQNMTPYRAEIFLTNKGEGVQASYDLLPYRNDV
jgi:hypothetical protein